MKVEEVFEYSEESPSGLVWKEDRYSGRNYLIKNKSKGDVAGSLGKLGYYLVDFNQKKCRVHRLVWELVNGPIPEGYMVDHIDGDKQNNKISNLRAVPPILNQRNRDRSAVSKSGIVGVRFVTVNNRKGKLFDYWKAVWTELDGTQKGKVFSIEKYGYEKAKEMAVEFRNKKLEELNNAGAGYSERHLSFSR